MKNVIDVMNKAASEIQRLRQDNRQMGEKLWLVENLLELRHLRGPSQGAEIDVVWELKDAAAALEKQAQNETAKTGN